MAQKKKPVPAAVRRVAERMLGSRRELGEARQMKKLYAWDQLFERPIFSLVRGSDYHCSPYAMGQQIRNEASRRGIRVALTTLCDDTFVVEITGRKRCQDKVAS